MRGVSEQMERAMTPERESEIRELSAEATGLRLKLSNSDLWNVADQPLEALVKMDGDIAVWRARVREIERELSK